MATECNSPGNESSFTLYGEPESELRKCSFWPLVHVADIEWAVYAVMTMLAGVLPRLRRLAPVAAGALATAAANSGELLVGDYALPDPATGPIVMLTAGAIAVGGAVAVLPAFRGEGAESRVGVGLLLLAAVIAPLLALEQENGVSSYDIYEVTDIALVVASVALGVTALASSRRPALAAPTLLFAGYVAGVGLDGLEGLADDPGDVSLGTWIQLLVLTPAALAGITLILRR